VSEQPGTGPSPGGGVMPTPAPERAEPRPPVPRQPPGEVDGPKGPEPTRFGDWEKGGRCTDF
jgi:hypothetical protein